MTINAECARFRHHIDSIYIDAVQTNCIYISNI